MMSVFSHTPTVTVLDNRGLSVRDIAYHRHPDTPEVTRERIACHRYNARGFLAQSADPRLHAAGRPFIAVSNICTAGARVLQDLRYGYDPVGNVLRVRNDAEETRFWRNQKVVPENTYGYDSLYQLVSATGREMANAGQQGCNLPSATIPLPTDGSAYTNYTRTYTCDEAGNLTQICHRAPATHSTSNYELFNTNKYRNYLNSFSNAGDSTYTEAAWRTGGQRIKKVDRLNISGIIAGTRKRALKRPNTELK